MADVIRQGKRGHVKAYLVYSVIFLIIAVVAFLISFGAGNMTAVCLHCVQYHKFFKMGLPQLESCCFVFDLKTGNIVIGAVNAFFSFALAIIFIVSAVGIGALENEMDKLTVIDPEEKAALTASYAMAVILVLLLVAKFLFDVVFIYGVLVERAGIIMAYMVMWIVFTILSVFVFFTNYKAYGGWHVFMEIFYVGLNIYFVLVNRSFYKLLNDREVV